jgi:hypothetical protein
MKPVQDLRIPAWMLVPEAADHRIVEHATLDTRALRALAALLKPLIAGDRESLK